MELATTLSTIMEQPIGGILLILQALLWLPQVIKIIKTQSAQGVSLIAFLGLFTLQCALLLVGGMRHDWLGATGAIFGVIVYGTLVILAFYYDPARSPKRAARYGSESAQIEMLDSILALMPGHVYWVGKDGKYLGCNELQARSAGLSSRADIIGKTNRDLPWNLSDWMLPEMLDQINQEVMTTGQTLCLEEPAVLKDGSKKIFLSTKAPLRNHQGDMIGMVGISVDITDRKQAEANLKLMAHQANEATQTQSAFLEKRHHDISATRLS